MTRTFPQVLCALVFAILLASTTASATTYYIAANGSDSNNGTSKSTPWLHAPGMKGCANVCASTSLSPGDSVILRGGDTWHAGTGSPIGLPWVINKSGSNGNIIYFGVDTTWFTGSAFARPILNMDNPLSTSLVSSCAFDDSSVKTIDISGASFVQIDNFEFTGDCSKNTSLTGGYVWDGSAMNNRVSNSYFHGWTVASGASDDSQYSIAGNPISTDSKFEIDHNVIDGEDSTFGKACTTPGCVGTTNSNGATGFAIEGNCPNVHHNVVRHVSNVIECWNVFVAHDNLFEYAFEPSFGGRHGNVMEGNVGNAGVICQFYNNITRNTNEGVDWWTQCNTIYVFNNVFENSGHYPPDPNGLMFSPVGSSNVGVVLTAFVTNNTFDGTIASQAQAGNGGTPHWAAGSTITWENNHVLDRTSISGGGGNSIFTCNSPSVCTVIDNGGEVFQTTSSANQQGYTLANDFQPTSGTGNTVGSGNSAAGVCLVYSSDDALCSGTSNGVTETAENIAQFPAIVMNPRSTSWDAGAYQFGSSASKPVPPTGLAAVVQ